jgi:hypothetical protein
MNCTEKFIKHSERVGARFAEYNAGIFFHQSNSSQLLSLTRRGHEQCPTKPIMRIQRTSLYRLIGI